MDVSGYGTGIGPAGGAGGRGARGNTPRKLPGARFFPARVGPKAAEDEDGDEAARPASAVQAGGLTLRAMLPNAVTAAAPETELGALVTDGAATVHGKFVD